MSEKEFQQEDDTDDDDLETPEVNEQEQAFDPDDQVPPDEVDQGDTPDE